MDGAKAPARDPSEIINLIFVHYFRYVPPCLYEEADAERLSKYVH